jgi:hypothetical protein
VDAADLGRSIRYTIAFERMAAIELRHMAEREPHLGDQLRGIADKLDAHAKELAQQPES